MQTILNKNKYYTYCKIVFFILVTTLLCSGASPFVNLVKEDQAILYAIGKCIAKGQVLFRDVCDHKGSYLFFLNALAYIISSFIPIQNFLALYLFEFLSMLSMAIYLYKIFNLYLNEKLSFYSLISFYVIYYYRGLFRFGNRYETWILTMQIISIYYIILSLNSLIKNDYSKIRFKHFLIHGVFVGIVFNMKLNYIAMWGALVYFFVYLIYKREYLLCFKNVVIGFLVGFIIANIPVAIYCIINNSFYETLFWSIGLNFAYVGASSISIWQKLYQTVLEITYLPVYVIILVGSVGLLLSKLDIHIKIYYSLSFVFSMFVVAMSYVGINFFHYNIYMLPFMIPFFILFFGVIHKFFSFYNTKLFQCIFYIFVLITIAFVNKYLGRTKPILTDTEKSIIENIQKDYKTNNNLKVFASDNEAYYVYCYTNVVPKKGIVICSMFLNVIEDLYYNKLYSLLNDNYDYIVLYNRFNSVLNDKWGLSLQINNMLQYDYDLIIDDSAYRCYKKH